MVELRSEGTRRERREVRGLGTSPRTSGNSEEFTIVHHYDPVADLHSIVDTTPDTLTPCHTLATPCHIQSDISRVFSLSATVIKDVALLTHAITTVIGKTALNIGKTTGKVAITASKTAAKVTITTGKAAVGVVRDHPGKIVAVVAAGVVADAYYKPDYRMIYNDNVASTVNKIDAKGLSFLKIRNEVRKITNKPSVAVPDTHDPKSGQNPVNLVNFEDTKKEFRGPADVIVDRIPQ